MFSTEMSPATWDLTGIPTAGSPPPALFRPLTRGNLPTRPVRLGDSFLDVYAFETRRWGEGRSCPPRTVGHAGMVVPGGARGLDWVGPREAVDLCLRGVAEPSPAGAAHGKVIFCNRSGDLLVFQADPSKHSAALCACGNATAAALLARCLGRRQVRQSMKLPGGQVVQVRSAVTRAQDGGYRVEQSWGDILLRVVQTRLRGREVALCTGTFNDYVIVRLPGTADLDAFGLEETLALWDEARRHSGFEDPLRSRLVALAPADSCPRAKFFTCGRAHPGAPLTGLATLALAARHVGWLSSLFEAGRVEHARGVDPLPDVRATPDGLEIPFPAIHAVLKAA
jgi:hypothetical protein